MTDEQFNNLKNFSPKQIRKIITNSHLILSKDYVYLCREDYNILGIVEYYYYNYGSSSDCIVKNIWAQPGKEEFTLDQFRFFDLITKECAQKLVDRGVGKIENNNFIFKGEEVPFYEG